MPIKKQTAKKPDTSKVKKQFKNEIDKAKRKFSAAEKKIKGYAAKHPEKAALIAASVGAAIGSALTIATRKAAKTMKNKK
jgi:hypothetical protein